MGYKVGSGDSFMVMGDLFVVDFCCHHFKDGVKSSLCRFKFVFYCEEEETAYRLRSLHWFDACEKGNSIMSLIVLIILGNVCGLLR